MLLSGQGTAAQKAVDFKKKVPPALDQPAPAAHFSIANCGATVQRVAGLCRRMQPDSRYVRWFPCCSAGIAQVMEYRSWRPEARTPAFLFQPFLALLPCACEKNPTCRKKSACTAGGRLPGARSGKRCGRKCATARTAAAANARRAMRPKALGSTAAGESLDRSARLPDWPLEWAPAAFPLRVADDLKGKKCLQRRRGLRQQLLFQ